MNLRAGCGAVNSPLVVQSHERNAKKFYDCATTRIVVKPANDKGFQWFGIFDCDDRRILRDFLGLIIHMSSTGNAKKLSGLSHQLHPKSLVLPLRGDFVAAGLAPLAKF